MSNLPKSGPLRGAVEEEPGWLLLQGDLSSIERRAQAVHADEPTMKRIFSRPEDNPAWDIYRVYPATRDNCTAAEIPAKGGQRNRAEVPVLSLAYLAGAGPVIKTARDYGLRYTEPQALAVKEEYYRIFPGIKRWHDRAWLRSHSGLIKEGRSNLGRRRLVLS